MAFSIMVFFGDTIPLAVRFLARKKKRSLILAVIDSAVNSSGFLYSSSIFLASRGYHGLPADCGIYISTLPFFPLPSWE